MGKSGGRDAGPSMLGPNFRLPRYIKKSKRPSGSTAIHKKRRIWRQGFSRGAQGQRQKKLCSKEIVPRSFRTHLSRVAWTAPSCPGKRIRYLGQSSRGPNPAPTRLLRRGDGELVFPRSWASGPIHFRSERDAKKTSNARTRNFGAALYGAWRGGARVGAPDFTLPLRLPQQAEPALPRGGASPVLTLAADPEAVWGDGLLHCLVVALCSFPSSYIPRSRRRPERQRETILAACSAPPARPPRSAGQSGVVSRPAPR